MCLCAQLLDEEAATRRMKKMEDLRIKLSKTSFYFLARAKENDVYKCSERVLHMKSKSEELIQSDRVADKAESEEIQADRKDRGHATVTE